MNLMFGIVQLFGLCAIVLYSVKDVCIWLFKVTCYIIMDLDADR